ncbi:VrrA/YqfQ family protein [Calidifontibacillus oryziterrae]|uniref:VrrA/YqfQ family protein n=1 Tax=Calidifontibacillus oryziterrae TaxID=1191699 RepID=UPI0002E1540D|nr:VrrA/YqfQ family protein [Calidifontibacillus oryziterrae]
MYQYRTPRFPPQVPFQNPATFMQYRQPMQSNFGSRGIGRFISRLFGNGSGANGAPFNRMNFPTPLGARGMFAPNMYAGFGNSFANVGQTGLPNMVNGISGMLNNVQKTIGLVQQFGPLVQQYGPFIKNMPAMLKIMKELNSMDSADTTEQEASTDKGAKDLKDIPNFAETENEAVQTNQGQSRPKLYI